MTLSLRLIAIAVCVSLAPACDDHKDHDDDGHSHGDHSHGDEDHGHAHDGHAEEESSIACTTWSNGFELFVELDQPSPGKDVGYHAHVTKLDSFTPASEGRFSVDFKKGDASKANTTITGVARPGIFTPQGTAPTEAGEYSLIMEYEHDGTKATFDCGTVTVGGHRDEEEAGPSELSFLKEQQWQVPFGTGVATRRPLAAEVELPAVIEPAGSEQLTISAPTGGRFYYNPDKNLAAGVPLEKGELLGRIVPMVAGDDYSELSFAAEEARIHLAQIQREIERIKPLVDDGLLPAKRLIGLENEKEAEETKLRSAQARLGAVASMSDIGGLPLNVGFAGELAEVYIPNGEPVEAGSPIARLRGSQRRWIRARFVSRAQSQLEGAKPAALRLDHGERVSLTDRAKLLSALPAVDPRSRLATWIAEVAAGDERTSLATGESVVLILRVGTPEPAIAVPVSAVVDINTRDFVFVQTSGESFAKRRVELGRRDGDYVEIKSGVAEGERVVTKGGYDIHLASLMGTVESHRH